MAKDIPSNHSLSSQQDTGDTARWTKDKANPASSNLAHNQTQDNRNRHSAGSKTADSIVLAHQETGKEVPVNRNRVSEVRNAIARGEYCVDVERVADRLIDLESSLHDETEPDR